MTKAELLQRDIQELAQTAIEHLKMVRDYSSSPQDVWLARMELNRIQELTAELEQQLTKLKETAS